MTQTNDAERPHEYSGCSDDDYCIEAAFGKKPCGQPRDAAVHQVAPCRVCGETVYHIIGCAFDAACDSDNSSPVLNSERVAGEPLNLDPFADDPHKINAEDADYPDDPPASEQDAVPPERRYESSDGRKWSDQPMSDTDIEYLAAAPIQAVVKACEANMLNDEDYWCVRKSDWNALVAAVKGKK